MGESSHESQTRQTPHQQPSTQQNVVPHQMRQQQNTQIQVNQQPNIQVQSQRQQRNAFQTKYKKFFFQGTQPIWIPKRYSKIQKKNNISTDSQNIVRENKNKLSINLYLVRHAFSEGNYSKRKAWFSPDVKIIRNLQPIWVGLKLSRLLSNPKNCPTVIISSNMIRAMLTSSIMVDALNKSRTPSVNQIYVSPNLKEILRKGQSLVPGHNVTLSSPDEQFQIMKGQQLFDKSKTFLFDESMLQEKSIQDVIKNQSYLNRLKQYYFNAGSERLKYLKKLSENNSGVLKQGTKAKEGFIKLTANQSTPLLLYKKEAKIGDGDIEKFLKEDFCKLLPDVLQKNKLKIEDMKSMNVIIVTHGKLIKKFLSDFKKSETQRSIRLENCDIVELKGTKIWCDNKVSNGNDVLLPQDGEIYQCPPILKKQDDQVQRFLEEKTKLKITQLIPHF